MKKLIFGILVLALVIAGHVPTMARADVDVHIGIGLPLPIVFAAPPRLIVVPETYVYVVPDIPMDLFFYGGWWWRPWQGRWYCSRHYNSGWVYFRGVPSFYGQIHSDWRDHYRHHIWKGHRWKYQPIPHYEVERNWRDWGKSRHWEHQNWGVQGLRHPGRSQSQPSEEGPQYRGGRQEKLQQQIGNHGRGKGKKQS